MRLIYDKVQLKRDEERVNYLGGNKSVSQLSLLEMGLRRLKNKSVPTLIIILSVPSKKIL